ncbi:hypothetical protein B0H16DRAFT_1470580 [Mycena metata]|uniref:Mitochondrial splicing suppressor 51-like C-terminal domain-containing protein n=1 Tax=Mycena metata TaxID=1033252 RepID=A0AAD7HTU2_9AGAR|nr:hypothetical protein B0H16DRAFT_1470580 [Mycena metata]
MRQNIPKGTTPTYLLNSIDRRSFFVGNGCLIMENTDACCRKCVYEFSVEAESVLHDYVRTKGKPSKWPDVCVAFNSGAAQTSQKSWSATLKVLVDRKIPILFTALYRAEAEGEAVLLQAAGTTLHPELGLTKNPRGSLNERSSPTTPVRSELELSSVNENSNRGPIRNIKKDRRRTSDAIPKIRLPSRAPVESSAVQYRGVTRIQRAGGWGGIPFSWKLNWKRIDTETRFSRQRLPRQPDEAALGHREDRENGERRGIEACDAVIMGISSWRATGVPPSDGSTLMCASAKVERYPCQPGEGGHEA